MDRRPIDPRRRRRTAPNPAGVAAPSGRARREPGPSGRAWTRGVAIALIAVGTIAVAAAPSCRSSQGSCAVCARDECRALAFRIEWADGGADDTCCARCASHAVIEAKGRAVKRLLASDFAGGGRVDAAAATYVEGSDFEHCSAPKTERSYPGCCLEMAYDRCLPSLVAFRSRDDAVSFVHEHGGRLRTFEDLRFGEPRSSGERP